MLLTPALVKLPQSQHFDLCFRCLGIEVSCTFDVFETYVSHAANALGGGVGVGLWPSEMAEGLQCSVSRVASIRLLQLCARLQCSSILPDGD